MPFSSASLRYLLTTLLFAIGPVALAQDAAKASRYYEDALQRFERRDIAGSIIQLKNALQADKNQLAVQVLLGKALLADSQPAAAEVAFNEALRLGVDRAEVCVPLAEALNAQGKQRQLLADPRLTPQGLNPSTRRALLLVRAVAQADMGESANAMTTIAEARSLDPGAVESWLAEVPLRIRARQWPEALAAANQALKLRPDSADAIYQKAAVMHASGNLQDALALYTRLLAKTPKHLEALIARAGLLTDLNRDDDALKDISVAQSVQPKEPRSIYLRGLISDRRGDKAGTHAALKQVTDLLDPVPIEVIAFRTQLLMLNGLSHYGLGELGKAKPYLELAARQQPGSPLLKLLANIAIAEPDLSRAQDLLETYIRYNTGDGQALLMLASLYVNQGRGEKAAGLMQEALKRNDTPDMRAVLGASLMQIGQSEQALGQLEKAYKANPKQLYGALSLVKAYARVGRLRDALRVSGEVVGRQPNDPAVALLDAALHQASGDLNGARQGFQRALRLNPQLVDAQLGLARIDALSRSFDSAEKRLRDLLRTNERSADVQFELALLNELRGRDDEAEKWLRGATEASNNNKANRADFALVEWYLRKSRPAQALQAAKILAAKAPDDIEVLRVLASAQLASGELAKARQSLTAASRKASFNAALLTPIASLQIRAQDLQGAAYSLDKALNGSPNNADVLALQAQIDLMRNDSGAAEAKARQLLKLNAKSETALLLLADAARQRNLPQQEVDYLHKLQDIRPSSQNIARLITAQSSQGRAADARASADAWLRRNPGDTLALKAIGDAEARAGRFASARQRYEAAVKANPADVEALNNLANVMIHLKDGASVQVAEQALILSPQHAALLDTAGWANLKVGKLDRAIQLLRDARLRAPNQAEVRYHLGMALALAGRKDEAKTELQAAIQTGRNFEGLDEAKRTLVTLN